MKKTLLFLLLAVASAPAAFSQARPGGELSSKDYTGGGTTSSRNTGFGFKAGYNLNSLRGDDISGTERDTHNDFHAGVYGQFGFNEFASLQAELLYSRQGFGSKTNSTTGNSDNTYRMDYLSLPIMFVGNITETISFHVGPQLSLLVNASRENTSLGLSDNGFHTLDYGGVGGVEARVGPARVGARYNLGLGKLFQEATTSSQIANNLAPYAGKDIYNNLFQLYVGIGFTQ